jgi:streptogramin lyase
MAVDSVGRIWFTDEVNKKVALYDRRTHLVNELSLPRRGAVSAMLVDGSGTLWAGTEAGELFAIRSGLLVGSTTLARPVLDLALDPSGGAWYLSGDSSQHSFGSVRAPAGAQAVPASVGGLWFDARGHAWLPDRASSLFFIAVPEAR